MLENNNNAHNGQATPRFFDDENIRKKKNKSSPIFKKNLVPICKEEKLALISYKPKTKKNYYCCLGAMTFMDRQILIFILSVGLC